MATIPEALAIAQQHHQAGRLEAAEQIYRRILNAVPDHADALHLLGVVALQLGQHAAAAEHISRAIAVLPSVAEFHYNLGNALKNLGRLDEAAASYRRAIELRPDLAAAYNNLGNTLKQQGKFDQAIACFRSALHYTPGDAEVYNNLGIALMGQGNRGDAAACYRQALALRPEYAEAYFNLGNALKDQGNLDEAVHCFQQTLRLRPGLVEAHNNLGNVLKDQGKFDQAADVYRRALELKPDHAVAHNNLGGVLMELGRLDEAAACCRRALDLKPDLASSHDNLGLVCQELGRLDEADACFRRAVELQPDCADAHLNWSMLRLLRGDFQRGWAGYEWRWQTRPPSPHFGRPSWRGEPLEGRTILLHWEQGLGDTIQFIRYAAVVKAFGGRVVVECQRALRQLLARTPGMDQLIAPPDEPPAFDVQAPLLSLPGILKTTLETVPASVPYIFASPELVEQWRERLRPIPGIKIGIAWQGNPEYRRDRSRSIALSCFEPLARLEGVRLFSLQKGAGLQQLRDLSGAWPIEDLGSRLDEASGPFMDTAAVMKNLDLVIAPNTALAHLAGALGVALWVALPLVPDWRWLMDRDDSPWYPTARLFRQTAPGDWVGVFHRMARELATASRQV